MKNIKTILIAILIAIFFKNISGQNYHPFPTDSAQWSIMRTQSNPFLQNTWQLKMKGDTLLNGLVYNKIYYSNVLDYSSPYEALHCFLREDMTKKIFVKYPVNVGIDTSEFMLYDFNLQLGDTVSIRLLNYSTDSIYKFIVGTIGYFEMYPDSVKFYRLGPIPPIWPCSASFFDWREGFGNPMSLLYNEIPENGCDGGNDFEVACFWRNGFYVTNNGGCDYNSNVNEINNKKDEITVIPNPVNNISYIELNDDNVSLLIYNSLGILIKTYYIKGQKRAFLYKRDFSTGIYFYKLLSTNYNYKTCKFIVQ